MFGHSLPLWVIRGPLPADPSVPQSSEPNVFSDLVFAPSCLGTLFLSSHLEQLWGKWQLPVASVKIPARTWGRPLHPEGAKAVLSNSLQTAFSWRRARDSPIKKREGLTCYLNAVCF